MSNATLDLIDAILDVLITRRWNRAMAGGTRRRHYNARLRRRQRRLAR